MKANELRIGNWVLNFYGIPGTLVSIHEDNSYRVKADGEIDSWGEENIKPIELTPEVLKKCVLGKRVFIDRNFLVYSRDSDDYVTTITTISEVKYLHRLQNIHFALTQTELTYQP